MPAQQGRNKGNRQKRRQLERSVNREAQKIKAQRDAEIIAKRGGTATSAAEWRKGREPVLVLLPSGHVCKAINRGMDAFLKAGKIPNSLMPIVQDALNKAEGKPPKAKDVGNEVLKDPEMMQGALDLCNLVVCDCVVEPRILPIPTREGLEGPVPIPLEQRDDPGEDALWVDETDLDDRYFILNWVVGGTQDVEQFRSELADVVDGISAGDEAEPEAE